MQHHLPTVSRRGGLVRVITVAILPLLATPVATAAQLGSPAGPVAPEALEARRQSLLDRMRPGVAVVSAAGLRDIEQDYPQDSDFRQANDFFYLTGLETPDARLVLVAYPDGRNEVTLFLPPRNPMAERWTGPKLGPGVEAQQRTGVADVRPLPGFEDALGAWISDPGSPVRDGAFWVADPPCTPAPGGTGCVSETLGGVTVRPLGAELAALRVVKDPDELTRLRRAIQVTAAAQRAAMQAARPGLHEYELEAVIEYTFRSGGAERVGFPSIVGSGPNSTVLHYDKNRRRMEPGDLVVMDIGAEYGYYTADVTRTIPVSGRFTERQRALYELVLATQQAALDAVRPGVTLAELTGIARGFMRDHSGDLCGERTCDAFFMHGLGHWLGMDVHDVGDYATPLAPGMVFTLEPGIYLPDEALGIRIEDDVLVTADGGVLLSDGAPRRPEEVEALMAEDYVVRIGAGPGG